MLTTPLLEMRGISKRFPGVIALDNVSLQIGRGEVLAICGENGAGKSTLMKILGGVHQPDAGEILIEGQPVNISTSAGVGIYPVHGEDADTLMKSADLALYDAKRVGKNVYRVFGREKTLITSA